MVELAPARQRRRTQAERTAATRTALLEATIESLVETGYAGVTTAEIAARAGVTRGAQAHHFTNKAELVTEAVRYLTQKLIGEFVTPLQAHDDERATVEQTLDRLWAFHRSEVFAAAIELWSAARTDPELKRSLRTLESDIIEALTVTTTRTLPTLSQHPGTLSLLSTTLATMRGLALLTFVHDRVDREWAAARRDLMQLWNTLLDARQ